MLLKNNILKSYNLTMFLVKKQEINLKISFKTWFWIFIHQMSINTMPFTQKSKSIQKLLMIFMTFHFMKGIYLMLDITQIYSC